MAHHVRIRRRLVKSVRFSSMIVLIGNHSTKDEKLQENSFTSKWRENIEKYLSRVKTIKT